MSQRLVVGTFTPSVLLALARRCGRLQDLGLAVSEVPVPSSPAQFRSLIDGDLDVALTSPDNVVAYRFGPANPLGELADVRIVSAVDRGMGLGLYGRPGLAGPDALRGARLAVDVPTSGFALAMYALADSMGVAREQYELATLGSTPQRLRALLAGECDATMLNAGNELLAEEAGCVRLASAAGVCAPYLGTVLSIAGGTRLDAARRLASALSSTARAVVGGQLDAAAREEAAAVLGLSPALAARYVQRMKSRDEGLVVEETVDTAALRTIVGLRSRYLPTVIDGADVLTDALSPAGGLVVGAPTRSG
jgi:ABC-type nitrate/sulfonate/bicarbonate transport system substrate-binding protein